MPFLFKWLCDLLEELDTNRHKRTLTTARTQSFENHIIHAWYQRFSHKIDRTGPSAIAFLSSILPERRPDRVYNLQSKRLSQVFGRSLSLGSSRASELNQWQNRDGADFATCVELTLQRCENAKPIPGKEVTLEEIDEALGLIAAHSISSSPAVRAKRTSASASDLLSPILRRLQSHEAKWLARMLLKSYAPVQIPEHQALHGFHFMLPNLLTIQNSFDAAIATLATEAIRQLPARPDKNYEYALQSLVSTHIRPRVGVMVKRQPYHKARSIKNCSNLASGRQMSVERKYDGEYCQIHVDLSKGHDCVQIFSKSGKDSTNDRIRLHTTIKDALRIGRNGCIIRDRCIVEGELLVWSTIQKQIQPFHKIRKYVKHGGREIGTAQDSPRRAEEHLMIAFYDILVLDDHMLLNKAHKVRRRYLKMALQTTEGRAILGERKIIDFRANRSSRRLRTFFAQAITQRWEGLVLKGSNEPYFSWNNTNHGIKLKKDYITSLGDTADFCIVGGRRNAHVELQIGLGDLDWTSFYIGAVCNKESMRRFDVKPRIKIIDILSHHSMPDTEILDLNRMGRLVRVEYATQLPEFDIEMGHSNMEKPSELFKKPFIVEVMGAGFEKLSNSSFYTLRFPRKVDRGIKLHTDRTLLDTVSFSELQEMAEKSMKIPEDKHSQEDAQWIAKLVRADGKKTTNESISQATTSTRTPTSVMNSDPSITSPEDGLSSPIFVRPDTEEPETQISGQSRVSLQSSYQSQGKDLERVEVGNNTTSQMLQPQLSKRKTRAMSISNTDKATEKRPRLGHKAVRLGESNVTKPPPEVDLAASQRKQETSVGQETADNQGAVAMETNSGNNHSLPTPKRMTTGDVSQDSTKTSCVTAMTPESTLIMRQILVCQNSPAGQPTEYSPTRALEMSSSFVARQPSTRKPHQQTNTNPKFLATPPASSPAMRFNKEKRPQISEVFYTDMMSTPGLQHKTAAIMPNITTDHDIQTSTSTVPLSIPVEATPTLPNDHIDPNLQPPHNSHPILLFNLNQNLLRSTLPDVHASFTFSSVHFLSHIDAAATAHPTTGHTTPEYRLILVDSLAPELAADALEDMAYKIQAHLQCTHPNTDVKDQLDRYNDRIVVFDIRVLEHEDVLKAGGHINLDVLRGLDFRRGHGQDAALFCGILRMYARSVNGEGVKPMKMKPELKIGLKLEYKFDWLQ